MPESCEALGDSDGGNGGEEGHQRLYHVASYSGDECFGGKHRIPWACPAGGTLAPGDSVALLFFSTLFCAPWIFSSQCVLLCWQYNTLLILKKRKGLKLEFLTWGREREAQGPGGRGRLQILGGQFRGKSCRGPCDLSRSQTPVGPKLRERFSLPMKFRRQSYFLSNITSEWLDTRGTPATNRDCM